MVVCCMLNFEELYKSLISIEYLNNLENDEALKHVAYLIDCSVELTKEEGLNKALNFINELKERELTPKQKSQLYYFLSNAEPYLNYVQTNKKIIYSSWEDPVLEKQILNLRIALYSDGFFELSDDLKCRILTNLGIEFKNIGRFVEAIDFFDNALKIIPDFDLRSCFHSTPQWIKRIHKSR